MMIMIFICEHRGDVDIEHTLSIVSQLAQGTAHVHKDGLIHRDLKPDNVFLQDNKFVKLGDFGLSREVEATEGDPDERIEAEVPKELENDNVLTVDTTTFLNAADETHGLSLYKSQLQAAQSTADFFELHLSRTETIE